MAAVIAAMKASGIAERDLQTAGVQIAPRYDYTTKQDGSQEAKLVAYQVTNTLSVRVRDIGKTGEILDKSVTLGVNQGGGITFTNDDPAPAMDRSAPVAPSPMPSPGRRRSATLRASGSARSSRSPSSSQRAAANAHRWRKLRGKGRGRSVPVEAGENAYKVQVNVTFDLN